MKQIMSCKDCISFAICNSRFKEDRTDTKIVATSNMLIKCSTIRDYLLMYHKNITSYIFAFPISIYIGDQTLKINIEPLISFFEHEG